MAIEQFRLVDGYVNALPSRYWDSGADMTAYYCKIRNPFPQVVAATD
ncbi:hypothetical protein OHT76_43540 [Streptomyces sp. NBC_00287]|nr:hypothetical protein [Streptomyces sp. NBC_00287]